MDVFSYELGKKAGGGGGGGDDPSKYFHDSLTYVEYSTNWYDLVKVLPRFEMTAGTSTFTFAQSHKLEKVDLSGVDFSLTTSIAMLFISCDALKEINMPNNFPSVTNTFQLFKGCTSLEKIDMRGFDFTQLTNYNYMFGSGTVAIPANCLIIVGDQTQKSWLASNFWWLTNVKTVEEYESE